MWDYIPNTNKQYIITKNGQVFSANKCDYLSRQLIKNKHYAVKLKINNKYVMRTIKSLLKDCFPEEQIDKNIYMQE